jgi:hypothetical protein
MIARTVKHGAARLRFSWKRCVAVLALVLTGSLAYAGFWRFHLKRFEVVSPGALYRSAQPTEFGLEHVVNWHGVRTVLCVRREDPRLHEGLFDLDHPNGARESEFTADLGARHIHWPMGGEAFWPWVTPWQFEEFFELFDNPANLPVLVHCIGGRHRTGTIAALYRLEYDRWPHERALREMEQFDFGTLVPVQNHNLWTYFPRPVPNGAQWQALRRALAPACDDPPTYAELVRRLRSAAPGSSAWQALHDYLRQQRPFALCLAQRIVDSPDHPLADWARGAAMETLLRSGGDPAETAMAAALIADFGTPGQQRALLRWIEDEQGGEPPTARYHALVCGVTNRYTVNRIPYLPPLLRDLRRRPDCAYRYCDTAVARLSSITGAEFVVGHNPSPKAWEHARTLAAQWLRDHPQAVEPRPLDLPVRGAAEPASLEWDAAPRSDQDDYRREEARSEPADASRLGS